MWSNSRLGQNTYTHKKQSGQTNPSFFPQGQGVRLSSEVGYGFIGGAQGKHSLTNNAVIGKIEAKLKLHKLNRTSLDMPQKLFPSAAQRAFA